MSVVIVIHIIRILSEYLEIWNIIMKFKDRLNKFCALIQTVVSDEVSS